MYKVLYTIHGGSYDDRLEVNGEILHGKIQTRVYRAIVDGKCRQIRGIKDHLIKRDMWHSREQISSALQSLKKKGLVKYQYMWLPTQQVD